MRPFVKDTVPFLHNAIKEGKHILIEGAQSAILDIDFGKCNLSLINHIGGVMVRSNKKICVFTVTCQRNLGSIGRH